ncbi:calmodulin-A-like [Mizuhopecten yessoensis]|uniref:Calmodulin n=1 Tax=Mizuhopecten yessoensis TaxID=6573 RepID=A0A210PKQ9_MIZYE|nr:calmodulin-A-like [Mizuhopecten yessoensis]OWF37065.1 Calmodulin [Mizuhopecten yessoensis]
MAQRMEKMMTELREAYLIQDKDDDHKINISELGSVMRSIGLSPTQAQLASIAQEYGASANSKGGKLFDIEECKRIVQKNAGLTETPESLRDCFRIFDKDGNGYNNASEIRHVLTTLGEPLRDEEVDELTREIELTVDGQFNYEEVVQLLTQ